MTIESPTRPSDVLHRARDVAARIRAARAEIDEQGILPAPVVAVMQDAGLFRLLVPASLGGEEVDALVYSLVTEEIGRADGSAAWCVMQGSAAGTLAALMSRAAAEEVFGDPRTVLAMAFPHKGMGRAEPVEGGYRVSGSFSFASGVRHSNWVVVRAYLWDGDHRRETPGGWLNFLVPIADAEIAPSWDVRGLRATSSDTYSVEAVFVPERFAVPFGRHREPGRLYRLGDLGLAHLAMAGAALGMASDVLDEFVTLATGKFPGWTGTRLSEAATTQIEVARCTAQLDATRALRDATARSLWDAAESGPPPPEVKVRTRLAISHIIDTSVEVTNTLYRLSGTTAIVPGHPIQRHFQDINVLSQQIVGRRSYYETVGKALLGLEYETAWI